MLKMDFFEKSVLDRGSVTVKDTTTMVTLINLTGVA